MSVAPQLDQLDPSPLASARVQRKLTVEEAARRAGLTAEQVEWLEAGRGYRFPSPDDALLALVLYATPLRNDPGEGRGRAGLPVEPRAERLSQHRIASAVGGLLLLGALTV